MVSEIKKKILDETRQQLEGYSRLAYEEFSLKTPEQRKDFEDHSIVALDRLDDGGSPVRVMLINSDIYQKNYDPSRFAILLLSPGGRDEQAVGVMVRKDSMDRLKLRLAEDSNLRG